ERPQHATKPDVQAEPNFMGRFACRCVGRLAPRPFNAIGANALREPFHGVAVSRPHEFWMRRTTRHKVPNQGKHHWDVGLAQTTPFNKARSRKFLTKFFSVRFPRTSGPISGGAPFRKYSIHNTWRIKGW